MSINVLTMTLNQALIPPEIFGRVQGARRTLTFGMAPLGALLGGMFAHAFGVRPLYIAAGVLQLLLAVPLWLLVRRHRTVVDTLEPAQGPPPPPRDQPAPARHG